MFAVAKFSCAFAVFFFGVFDQWIVSVAETVKVIAGQVPFERLWSYWMLRGSGDCFARGSTSDGQLAVPRPVFRGGRRLTGCAKLQGEWTCVVRRAR